VNSSPQKITTWKEFARVVRAGGWKLLRRLDQFHNSILITGCQRSGTTMLSRIITGSNGMVNYRVGADDELDAALILSGFREHAPKGRYCFQTTYLNDCFKEYFDHADDHTVVWVLRQPFSVVYSMLHNWKDFALNELFLSCGAHLLGKKEQKLFRYFGIRGVSRIKRACLSYCGKVSQMFELQKQLNSSRFIVVDYDGLVKNKNSVLPALYSVLELPYLPKYGDLIHNDSIEKHHFLSVRDHEIIKDRCKSIFSKAREMVTFP
jgi:hypothetical protein